MIKLPSATVKNADNKREEKGKRIANKKDAIKRLDDNRYRVRSRNLVTVCIMSKILKSVGNVPVQIISLEE